MSNRPRGRPKREVWEEVKAWVESVKLRFEIDGIEEISEPAQPGHKERIAKIAEREHRTPAAIEDRAFRPNRKKKYG
jgi:hypothetical protein